MIVDDHQVYREKDGMIVIAKQAAFIAFGRRAQKYRVFLCEVCELLGSNQHKPQVLLGRNVISGSQKSPMLRIAWTFLEREKFVSIGESV